MLAADPALIDAPTRRWRPRHPNSRLAPTEGNCETGGIAAATFGCSSTEEHTFDSDGQDWRGHDGTSFLLPRFRPWQARWEDRILLLACSSLFLEMLVAIYVHLQPRVPPEVLPLGIKPPVIPLFVLLLDVMVALWTLNDGWTEGLPISFPTASGDTR